MSMKLKSKKLVVLSLAGLLAFGGAGVVTPIVESPNVAEAAYGPDLSVWNGTVYFGQVAGSGKSFAIVKEGEYHVDYNYHAYVAGARANGMAVGHYWFASPASGATIAEQQVANLYQYHSGDPLVFDYEGAYAQPERVLAWAQRMKQLKPNSNLIVYANTTDSYRMDVGALRALGVRLWIASYRSAPAYNPAWGGYAIWQYTSTARIPGVSGNVDMNFAVADAWTGSSVPAGTQTSTGRVVTNSTPTFNGYSVIQIQTLLRLRGFFTAVDGIYGSDTRAKVRQFQASRHIGVDGVVGPVTWAWLQKVYQDGAIGNISIRRAQVIAGTPIDGVITGGRVTSAPNVVSATRYGTSSLVRTLQSRMGGIRVDGKLGPQTIAKLQWWLTVHGYANLRTDGILGPATAKAWQKALEAGYLF